MKQDESKNKFICFFCRETRYRGLFVKVSKGPFKHVEVKCCQKPACIDLAKQGQLEDAMNAFVDALKPKTIDH